MDDVNAARHDGSLQQMIADMLQPLADSHPPLADSDAPNTSYETLCSQIKAILDAAEGKASAHHRLQADLQHEKRSAKQLQQLLAAQQLVIDGLASQDALVAKLTLQLAEQSTAVEQFELRCKEQNEQCVIVDTYTARYQKELWQKRKRVDELELEREIKQQDIEHLEHKLQQYRDICSYVTSKAQKLEQQSTLPRYKQRAGRPRKHAEPQIQQQSSAAQQDSFASTAIAAVEMLNHPARSAGLK